MSDKTTTKLDAEALLGQFTAKAAQPVATVKEEAAPTPAPKAASKAQTMLGQYMAGRRKQGVGTGSGRLLLSLDATASRAATWTLAAKLQAEMLRSVARDTLDLKVVFYRGTECKKTNWTSNSESLARSMAKVECITGLTQIKKILEHALAEEQVDAVIFVGDAMEESIDELSGLASDLGAQERPVFMFQEGDDTAVERAFKTIAERSGGAYFKFGTGSPQAVKQFADTLNEIANAVTKVAIGDASAISAIAYRKEK